MSKRSSKKPESKQPKLEFIFEMVEWFDSHWYHKRDLDGKILGSQPSVTTVIGATYPKPEIEFWRSQVGYREANKVMNEAADAGSRIHYAIQTYLSGGVVLYQPPMFKKPNFTSEDIEKIKSAVDGRVFILSSQEEMAKFHSWREWFKSIKGIKVMGVEQIVYSDLLCAEPDGHTETLGGSAGSVDQIYWLDANSLVLNGEPQEHLPTLLIHDVKTGKPSPEHKIQIAAYAKLYEFMTGGGTPSGLISYVGVQKIKQELIDREEIEATWEIFLHLKAVWNAKFKKGEPKTFDFPVMASMNEIKYGRKKQ